MIESKSDLKKIICSNNQDILEQFLQRFPEQIDLFVQELFTAFSSYKLLDGRCVNDEQKSYIAAYIFQALNNLIISFNLLIFGNWMASGNFIRQYLESIFMAILFSHPRLDKDYFQEFRKLGNEFKVYKCFDYVEKNLDYLDIDPSAWENIKKTRTNYNAYSHSSPLSLTNIISFSNHGAIIGFEYDVEKEDFYIKEIFLRISAAKNLQNVIDYLNSKE